MREFVFDIEADGLLDTITKIHCLSYSEVNGSFKSTLYDQQDIREFLTKDIYTSDTMLSVMTLRH